MLYSPLRYPGGKNKLSGYIKKLLDINNLKNCTYIEPYAGGAGVALSLLIDGYVNRIIINDFDRSIYAFWYSVLYYTDELCDKILHTNIDMKTWHEQKKIQENKENVDLLTLGFSTFFLNRTNRSGIIKAGVIGGLNQDGNYKLDCRFKKDILISKIRLIASYKSRIKLYNLDTLKLISSVISRQKKPCFIFFDPPYYNKGSQLYANFYNHDDHLELSKKISSLKKAHWIVTYDKTEQIQKMYNSYDYNYLTYGIRYTAGKKYTGYEIMFFSNNLIIYDDYKSII